MTDCNLRTNIGVAHEHLVKEMYIIEGRRNSAACDFANDPKNLEARGRYLANVEALNSLMNISNQFIFCNKANSPCEREG